MEDSYIDPNYEYVHAELQRAGAVGKIATAVVARLRNVEFGTLSELNAAIREQLDAYNARPFQKRDGSRREVFTIMRAPPKSGANNQLTF